MLFRASLVITVLAFVVLWRMAPRLMRGRGKWAFLGVAAAVHLAWMLLRMRDERTASTFSWAVGALSSSWVAAMVFCFVVGGPLALVLWLVSLRRKVGRLRPVEDAGSAEASNASPEWVAAQGEEDAPVRPTRSTARSEENIPAGPARSTGRGEDGAPAAPMVLTLRGEDGAAEPPARSTLRPPRTSVPVNEGRRQFLGLALPATAVTVGVGGTVSGLRGFEVRHEEVSLGGWPRALDGFRIGQITDVHVGDFVDAGYLRAAVEAMNAERVDLQVMTGDLIDDLSQLEDTMAALEACTARHGMLAILGNHEIWRGRRRILDAYRRSAERSPVVRLLIDESTELDHDGVRIRVVGVDYPYRRGGPRAMRRAQRNAFMKESAERAFTACTPGEPTLCLTHHPEFFNLAAQRGVHLTLAGHTHGGQIALLRQSLVGFVYEYMLGQYRRGDAKLYVSGGTGHWFPFRLGVPPEVTILTLRSV